MVRPVPRDGNGDDGVRDGYEWEESGNGDFDNGVEEGDEEEEEEEEEEEADQFRVVGGAWGLY